jgi:hypothetical protein
LFSDNYQEFLKTAPDHPGLRLFASEETPSLSAQQREHMFISLSECAYLLLYEEDMKERQL